MNRSEFVDVLTDRQYMYRSHAVRLVNAVLALITEQLVKGEKVSFHGFGSFECVSRAARKGRNPITGEPMTIPAFKSPKFTASPVLVQRLNGEQD